MALSKPRARFKPQPSLSEREQGAVMRVYDSYFSNYINGDVKAVAKVLDDEYSQVGSAESEVFFNKKDAVKFLYDTVDQVAGKVQMRNREIRIEPHPEFVLILDLSDLYVKADNKWVFHSKFRASSFMRKKKGGWKIYHQHSSFPDLRAQDGENISIEKVAQENIQLRDAVKRRTVELEQKTRDLEVEAALERVRARAMGMRNSSELAETSSVLFHQLKKLQINAIRTSVGIFDDPNEAIELWVTAISDNREVIETLNYVNLHIHPVFENLIPARKQKKPFALTKLTGNQVEEYYQHHYLSLPNQRSYNETEFFYSFFFSQGTLNVVARQALTDEQCNVLTRFAAVFGLIYTRFLDLQQAEAQAREAKIEAALERIRARAMAMHSSSELMEVADVLREQMAQLGQPELETSALHLYEEEPDHIVSWRAFRLGSKSKGKITKGRMAIPNNSCELVKEWLAKFHSGAAEYTVEVSGKKQKEWYKVLFQLAPEVGEAMIKQKRTTEPRYYHFSTFSGGALLMVSMSLPSDESIYLQRRAAGVFDLAYRRFLDLKKAEALASEAKVELAMERVRARAMAMQRSDELAELVATVFRELNGLDFSLASCIIWIHDPGNKSNALWIASDKMNKPAKPLNIVPFYPPFFESIVAAWRAQDPKWIFPLTGPEKKKFEKLFFNEYPELPEALKKSVRDHKKIVYSASFNRFGALEVVATEPLTDEKFEILHRFGKVFNSSYARFNDLQKAEAQAREAQIEAALERVRSRSMAMHHTSELQEVINTVHQQFNLLNIAATGGAFIAINEENAEELTIWGAGGLTNYAERVRFPLINRPIYTGILAGIKKGPGFFTETFSREEKIEFFNHLFRHPPFSQAAPERKKELLSRPGGYTRSCCVSNHTSVFIINHHGEKFSDEENRILSRFGNVFEQTYTRFLDLQKAEAQAREAQIEAALERVRSRSMAMHKSEELQLVINEIFAQLMTVEVGLDAANILIFQEGAETVEAWTAGVNNYTTRFDVPVSSAFHFEEVVSAARNGQDLLARTYGFEEKNKWFRFLFENTGYRSIPEERKRFILGSPLFTVSVGITKNVAIQINSYTREAFTESENNILKRFTNAFVQSYTRFLDLQKAENQAREAQIEAALERVRSRSLAMHKSQELTEVVFTLLEQLSKLEITTDATIILTYEENEAAMWIANTMNYTNKFRCPYTVDFFPEELASKKRRTGLFTLRFDFEKKNAGWEQAFRISELGTIPEERKKQLFASDCFLNVVASNQNTGLMLCRYTNAPFTEAEKTIAMRFSNVFEQAYTRFMDLQRAEAQAQEATIQASLERVRSKAMAMHNSKDLAETIHAFYKELVSLSLTPRRCGIGLVDKETRMAELSSMNTTEDGISVEAIGTFELAGHPVLEGVYSNWLAQKEYHPILRGNEIKEYYQLLRKQISFPDYPNDAVQYGYFFFFEEGGVYAWTEQELSEKELAIYRRFTSVISLTYKRYKDLKVAEIRAEEAVKQASLDRVRAEIASMRTADDLQRITPLIWRELTTLGVPFFRCGVMIVKEKEDQVDFYLSTPEGKPLAVLHLNIEGQDVTKNAMDHWRRQDVYIDHWSRDQFAAFSQSMLQQGQIQNAESYQGGEAPPESLTLQFTPFAQGMLYVGSAEPLSADQLHLVRSLADAFSTAYARYEDFTRLEAAKATVEKTLSELRTTQTQLVQSEKMASLGELTAGIAHEIQNPLNFVNNFSEVSKELLDEMKVELEKGNTADAKQIAADVIQNLEKINFHGKRADGIVKSMLQHSRKSTGQKELTDINALCDEYLRLAYHGLRAKDKSFNAKFETHLDPAVGKLSVLPQEIGRVILNLINNAFYAVSEKQRANGQQPNANYEPTVIVSTKNLGTSVEICVTDNGNGIPASIKDKIFQPFFTTKPTGQGTGLGLSLSYDIVKKGHGGELKVVTKEGEGSTFVITLPS